MAKKKRDSKNTPNLFPVKVKKTTVAIKTYSRALNAIRANRRQIGELLADRKTNDSLLEQGQELMNKAQEEISMLRVQAKSLREQNHLTHEELKRVKREEVGKAVYAVPTGLSERKNYIELPAEFNIGGKSIQPGKYYNLTMYVETVEADPEETSVIFKTASVSHLDIDGKMSLLGIHLNNLAKHCGDICDASNREETEQPTHGRIELESRKEKRR